MAPDHPIHSPLPSPLPPLDPYHLSTLPPTFRYIPDLITTSEEHSLHLKLPSHRWTPLSHRRVQAFPSALVKASAASTAPNVLPAAPLPDWLVDPIVPRLQRLGAFEGAGRGVPNHVLVNEYREAQGIMMHQDGDAYESVVATVSLGGCVCLDVEEVVARGGEGGRGGEADEEGEGESKGQAGKEPYILPSRIILEPRSVLITRGIAYETLRHGIEDTMVWENLGPETVANWHLLRGDTRDAVVRDGGTMRRGVTRVSLSYRDVKKVSRALGGALGRSLGSSGDAKGRRVGV